jgi:hypothetical protein
VDQRTWTYGYSTVAVSLYHPPFNPIEAPTVGLGVYPALRTVTLPDGRSWLYELGGMFAPSVPGLQYQTISTGQMVSCSPFSSENFLKYRAYKPASK